MLVIELVFGRAERVLGGIEVVPGPGLGVDGVLNSVLGRQNALLGVGDVGRRRLQEEVVEVALAARDLRLRRGDALLGRAQLGRRRTAEDDVQPRLGGGERGLGGLHRLLELAVLDAGEGLPGLDRVAELDEELLDLAAAAEGQRHLLAGRGRAAGGDGARQRRAEGLDASPAAPPGWHRGP